MTLYEQLRADLNTARKARDADKVAVYSTVVGEMLANAVLVDGQKTVVDEAAQAVLKKTIKGLDELLGFGVNEKASAERALLAGYLPKQLEEAELRQVIQTAISAGASNMGAVMSSLKASHAGLYDGKLASILTKELLGA